MTTPLPTGGKPSGTKSSKATQPNITPGKVLTLTPAQRQAWEMTRAALLWQCPAFTHIFYSMMAHGTDIAVFTDEIPIAATDGSCVFLNPEPFFKLTLNERVFVLGHEISHGMFMHTVMMHKLSRAGSVVTKSGKKLAYDQDLMNVAMDLVINDMLIEAKVGRYNSNWLHDPQYGRSSDSVVDVYEKVWRDKPKGKGPGGNGFDNHLQPGTGKGKDATTAAGEHNQVEWDTAMAAAAAAAKAQGKLPAALERMITNFIEPEVPWQEKIQAFFARKIGSGSYDWRRPDRRLIVRDIYAPGQSGFGAGIVALTVDTSGSMGQPQLDRIFAEMRGILEDVNPKEVLVIWCDAAVHRVDRIEDVEDLNALKPVGGGGTSFIPPFEWLAKEGVEPECMVYFTDGYGSFPTKAPKYPVLWGAVVEGAKYPWGEVVSVPVKD
jgi:predicted metal-dependent peptidase